MCFGSRGHVVGWLERSSLDTSASVRGQKEISDSQELEGAARAGLKERGHILSRQEVKVEHSVSCSIHFRAEKWVGEGRE